MFFRHMVEINHTEWLKSNKIKTLSVYKYKQDGKWFIKLGTVTCTCYPDAWKAEAGGSNKTLPPNMSAYVLE